METSKQGHRERRWVNWSVFAFNWSRSMPYCCYSIMGVAKISMLPPYLNSHAPSPASLVQWTLVCTRCFVDVTYSNGINIHAIHLYYMQITRKQVESYKPGHQNPSIQLQVFVTTANYDRLLAHTYSVRMHLCGAQPSYFQITLSPFRMKGMWNIWAFPLPW